MKRNSSTIQSTVGDYKHYTTCDFTYLVDKHALFIEYILMFKLRFTCKSATGTASGATGTRGIFYRYFGILYGKKYSIQKCAKVLRRGRLGSAPHNRGLDLGRQTRACASPLPSPHRTPSTHLLAPLSTPSPPPIMSLCYAEPAPGALSRSAA